MNNLILVVILFLSLLWPILASAAEKYEGEFEGYTSEDNLLFSLSVTKDTAKWAFSDVVTRWDPVICTGGYIITLKGICDPYPGDPYGPDIFSGTEFNCHAGGLSGSTVNGKYDPVTDSWSGNFSWSDEACSAGGGGTWSAKRVIPATPATAIQPTLLEILLDK